MSFKQKVWLVALAIAVLLAAYGLMKDERTIDALPFMQSAVDGIAKESEEEAHRVRMPEGSLYNQAVHSEDLATPDPDDGACGNPYLPSYALCEEDFPTPDPDDGACGNPYLPSHALCEE